MAQDPNSPGMQKVLNDILRSCQLVAGDIYDLIDQVCQNDVWSDEQITQIDALIETSKQSRDVKQAIQVLSTLVSIIDDVIVDKKAKLGFRNRQKKILVSTILKKHELYIKEQFETNNQAEEAVANNSEEEHHDTPKTDVDQESGIKEEAIVPDNTAE